MSRVRLALLLAGSLLSALDVGVANSRSQWARIVRPTAGRVECATRSPIVIEVQRLPDGSVSIGRASLEPQQKYAVRPDLPEWTWPDDKRDAVWHVLAVEGGWFVGRDGGEWGGALWWLSTEGRRQQIGAGNVAELRRVGERVEVVSTDTESVVEKTVVDEYVREDGLDWTRKHHNELSSKFLALGADGGSTYVLTAHSLVRISGGKLAEVTPALGPPTLGPYSMLSADEGIYVGMRLHWVLVNALTGDAVWYTPSGCMTLETEKRAVTLNGVSQILDQCVCSSATDDDKLHNTP